ncbi:MAG TPA: response regulator transcription factor [Candidatus Dojkabacteria bacterium]|jgi:DNA-binding response OmpR family regulator|nr:response regulator transcription factor [Candidatus Dojkabacteria bacterium]
MHQKTVLIVEDCANLVFTLESFLKSIGYKTMPVYDGSSGLQKAQLKEVSLILLDIGLPDISGLEVLEKVRNFTDKPVIVISADFSLKNKVSAFTGRANIFHEKPIDFELLKAQVDSLMHNTQITKKLILQNNIEIDSRTNTVSKSGKVIKFTSKESALFNLLVKNNKNIVSRKTAINVIDPFGRINNENSIDVTICRIRKKLHISPKDDIIKTISGKGYCLESKIIKK